ncbi:protein-tyrosine phosphatase [Pullulanibacillus pueri]|nr:protein-tyrosine phosphatase [Pullulanibacillus pueri]
MAEAILKQRAGDQYEVKSAGLFAQRGQSAHPNAMKVLADHGITHHHTSQPLTKDLVDWADVIFTMTEGHKNALIQQFPEAIQKTATLKGYVSADEDWKLWKEAMAEYQMKKAIYTNEKDKAKTSELEQELWEAEARIHTLEYTTNSIDIEDPFGGSEEVYQEVFEELQALIDQFIKKDGE